TATLVIVPETGNATVPWATGSMIPLRCSVWLTVAFFTVAVRNEETCDAESARALPPRTPPATTMPTEPAIRARRRVLIYSVLRASMGARRAARDAGYTPKARPMAMAMAIAPAVAVG